jgi:hypothetical protein
MILLQVDSQRIAFLELEGDAPRPIDMHGVTDRFASQDMEIEAGNIHLFRAPGVIQSIKSAQTALLQCSLNASGSARFEQLLQAFVPEAPNHAIL